MKAGGGKGKLKSDQQREQPILTPKGLVIIGMEVAAKGPKLQQERGCISWLFLLEKPELSQILGG